jgi:hypothetical protein
LVATSLAGGFLIFLRKTGLKPKIKPNMRYKHMKRLLSFLALTAAISFLVACSSQESMNGEYYEIGDYGTDLVITANITGSECQY